MIVRRVYKVAKESKGSTSVHQLQFVMRVLIESGFLYLAVALAHFISWWTPNSYAIEVISAIVSQLLITMTYYASTAFTVTEINICPILERVYDWNCF